ncbi:MAG: GlsB/YeaQ/YmgE family stress response membrane protein [Candidatus Pacebacteria bacterium]|nr:GlsB/YeaQ/YmgE family stress response membrane protein [Candidatus Paceibacterota bacterium]
MNILLWIIFGAIAGWLASLIMGTNARQGLLMDIVMGVIGALVGGFLFSLFGFGGVTGFNIYSLLVALVGAIVVTWIGRQFQQESV